MANFYDFSSDNINIFILILDESSSMQDDQRNVISGLKMYKKSFENFSERNSIAISVCKFNSEFHPSDFVPITQFDTNYEADGWTAVYRAIYEGSKHLNKYIEKVTEKTGCIPRATFILFSDGQSCSRNEISLNYAEKAISALNYSGVTTVFVAFGEGITSNFGKELGFMSTIEVTDRDALINFLGVELSKSCKQQSKSLKALGANFFSKAAKNGNSEAYSQTTKQALDDDNWFEDI